MKLVPRVLAAVAGAAALILAMAWFAGAFETTIDPQRPTPVAMQRQATERVVEVVQRKQARIETATGTVRAGYETLISARIAATVLAAPVRAGGEVAAGDLLFELDAREAQARVAQAQEVLVAAEARAADAERSAQRLVSLVDRGAASVAERDTAEAVRAVAAADVQRASDALAEARAARSYSTLRAPFGARLVERFVDPGDTVMPGTPMARLYDPKRLRLEADVRESLAELLRGLEYLDVRIDALDYQVRGRVEEIVPSSDPGSRTFVVKVGLPVDPALFPGMFGRLAIPVGVEERYLVPEAAVLRVGQLEFVRIEAGDEIFRRHVRTGPPAGDGMIEIRSGLRAGERVLVPAP